LQMAAFLSRTVDGALRRGGRRAAMRRFYTTQGAEQLLVTPVASQPFLVESDGLDVWVASGSGAVSRVGGSDGTQLGTWTGAAGAVGILSAMGRILVGGEENPGKLYEIDPSKPAGAVTGVASTLGVNPLEIAYDGGRVWTANFGAPGSVSIVTPGATIPWTVTTVATGFSGPWGILYDGANIWVTDFNVGTLLKLDSSGAILQTVTVGPGPRYPAFDGRNLWIPNFSSSSVSVVRASTGAVLQTLTGNGLNGPVAMAFDGQRVLATNGLGASVSLWKAADLSPAGSFPTIAGTPYGACSDGLSFWIAIFAANKVVRF
ncbi:MAG TPA: hypothetical protein VKG01_16440, partial [Thermoanaerobaculia bacterium]|nr:hypothetical protein [Thermoanaerobaculia bacterium]